MRVLAIKVLLTCVACGWIGAVSADDRPIDQSPMYGQPAIARPEFLKKADEDFIEKAVIGLGTREAASKAWFDQGEQYLRQGKLDFAMRRYNQSWLLNPRNYQPYWGFGRVLLERGNVDGAAVQLKSALDLIDDKYERVALLVDLGTAYSVGAQVAAKTDEAEGTRLFVMANQTYGEALSLDQTYATGWRRWAMSLYEQGEYAEAWEKVKNARARNARPFPPAFLRALEEKFPEPRLR